MSEKRVLWLDNDPGYIRPFVMCLQEAAIEVDVARSALAAEKLLEARTYDLVIIDVMIPTSGEEEERVYPPVETQDGHMTGLLFFRRWQKRLREAGTSILVMTVRIDKGIREQFGAEGLARAEFATKMELRNSMDFRRKIVGILEGRVTV